MLSIKKVFAHSIKQIFSICFLVVTFSLLSVFGQTQEAQPLSSNQTVERELGGSQTHTYQITLKANEFLQIQAEQKGIDIVVKLFDSNKKLLTEKDSPNGIKGFEILSIIVANPGVYTIEVSSLQTDVVKGNYTIFRRTPRTATEKDRKLIQANAVFAEAEKLSSERLEKSKRASLAKFEEARGLYNETGDKQNEAVCLSMLGNTLSLLREHQKALEFYNKALLLRRAIGDKVGEANTLLNIGWVYSALGEKQKAVEYHKQALTLYKVIGDKRSQADILNLLGLFFSSGKQQSLEFYNEALPLFRAVGDKDMEAYLLKWIGKLYSDLGENQKALESLNQALSLWKASDKFDEARGLFSFGIAYENIGEKQRALEIYDQVLPLLRNTGEIQREAEALARLQNIWFSLNNPRLAILYGKQSTNKYQELRQSIQRATKEFQNNYLKTIEGTYRKLADILIIEGRFPEAQAVLDLLKEEEFKQIVRRSGEPLYTLPYSKSEEDAIKIVDRLAALGRELSELKDKPKDPLTAAEIKRISEIESIEIPAANKALRQATEALSTIAPDVKNALDLKMKDNIQNILPALGKGVVALYTVVGKTSADETAENKSGNNNKITVGWILLVTPEIRKAYPIDTTDLEQTVFKLREALRSPKYDPQPLANELYKKLFLQTSPKQTRTLEQDLQETLGKHKDKTLMWSLDGVLRYVPMAALHDGKNYLVEKYRNVVFNTASLGSLKDSTKPNWEVVGLGVSTEGTVKAFDGRMLRFSALKGSETELNSIVKENNGKDTDGIFPGTLKINNEFTKEALFEGARTGMPVIHVSSHFWYNPTQEETSFLLLGNGGRLEVTEFQDYPNLFSNVDFLSLSACDTATGGNANNSNAAVAGKAETDDNARQSNGKEIEGFAYVAQTLGAKSVMASLWQVSDEGTKELMLKFYQIKKEQPELPKGEALRQAQLSLLRGTLTAKGETEEGKDKRQKGLVEEASGEGLKPFVKDKNTPFSHPYYWSPFVLIGNWR